MPRVFIGNVKGRPGRDGVRGETGRTGDRGTSYAARGEWVANAQYVNTAQIIDVVYYRGSSYYCKQTHSSSTPPDQDATNWDLICQGVERVSGRITLNPLDFSVSQSSDLYFATYTFPQGTFPADAMVDIYVTPTARERNGIMLGEVTSNSAKIYAESLTDISGVVVDVYYDRITPTVVNNA